MSIPPNALFAGGDRLRHLRLVRGVEPDRDRLGPRLLDGVGHDLRLPSCSEATTTCAPAAANARAAASPMPLPRSGQEGDFPVELSHVEHPVLS